MFGKKTSDYIKVQRSREIRLWLATLITGAIAANQYLEAHPEVKRNLRDKYDDFMNRYRKNPHITVYIPEDKAK